MELVHLVSTGGQFSFLFICVDFIFNISLTKSTFLKANIMNFSEEFKILSR